MPPETGEVENAVSPGFAENLEHRGADGDIFYGVGAEEDNRPVEGMYLLPQSRVGGVDKLEHLCGQGRIREYNVGQPLGRVAIIIAGLHQLQKDLGQRRQVPGAPEPGEYISGIFHDGVQLPFFLEFS
jgi:hypothetical protein